MNRDKTKTSEKPGSNYKEPQPEGKVPKGEKAVKKVEDEVYQGDEAGSTYKKPAKYKENSEQPVHSVKHPPKETGTFKR